jgi:TPP-dependent 2-oxoacid decarboxylase
VTVYQTMLRSLTDARYLIDKALFKALYHRKPVLLEVCRCGASRARRAERARAATRR